MSSVSVSIVNYNQGRHLPACLKAVHDQTLKPAAIFVVDNASSDGSPQLLETVGGDVTVILNSVNRGYAAAHNQVFRLTRADFILALNVDVVLDRHFLERSVEALQAAPRAGSACGKLYRDGSEGGTLDSTGLFPDRFRRFWDRDHDQADRHRPGGQIFGPSGSAALYRTAMLEDVAFDGQCFDESFFAYCEDADLAWRARRQGWTSIYVPDAVGRHVHEDMSRARSTRRDEDATFRQLLLIRNRHLCFLKNDRLTDLVRDLPWIAGYDVSLQLYLIVTKPRLALQWPVEVARLLPEMATRRRTVFRAARMVVRIADWFDWECTQENASAGEIA